MKEAWLNVRSAFFWTLSILHFVVGSLGIIVLRLLFPMRIVNPALQMFCRNIMRFAGARFEARRSPGCSPPGSFFYVVNHVEIFDPFIIAAATEGVTRGLELESHFRVPVYGWLMTRMGSVPVPNRPTRPAIERMKRRTRRALEAGINLVVYPEGTRTRTGAVGPFRPGVFRMAVEFGTPIVPVSVVGAYELKRVGSLRLNPAHIVVHVHDAVEPGDDPVALCHKVRQIVMGPLQAPEM